VYGQGPTANQLVTAGISMFMLLLQGGAVLDISAEQTAKQQERERKGSLGTDGTFIYLVVVENASLVESQYVLQALGATDAINLDGGGTAAMWIDGQYTVGPGRLLPNAILLTKP
jgi:exopolysaccharide biosynthesis protein